MANIIDYLLRRGFIEDTTGEDLLKESSKPLNVYSGFDPTSDSLHLGNMVAMMGLAWFQKFGHTPYVLIGGATGMIGDPSGRSSERQLLDKETLERNIAGIRKNLENFLDFSNPETKPVIVNNLDWFQDFSLVDFLRDVGKHFRLGPMLGKESVRARMVSEEGLSFTEFSYQLLQGYDFLHLHDQYNVSLQMGGSDQWGNITAGIDLVRKTREKSVHGLTFPLLTRSDGQKFGKSEKGAIWLSPEKLSPYEFYQYLIRVADADVIKLMRMLTFMEIEEIAEYEISMSRPDYIPNTSQKKLADEVTLLVHGKAGVEIAHQVTEGIAPGSTSKLDSTMLEALAPQMPNYSLARSEIEGVKFVDIIVKVGAMESKGDVKRLIRNGGVYLNNVKLQDENFLVTADHLIDGNIDLIALGKKNKLLIRATKF